MKITLDEAYHWGSPGFEGWSYGSRDTSPAATASVVSLDGRHGKAKSPVSDRLLYILEGSGEVQVGDETFAVNATDVVVLPRDTPFDLWGKMRYLVVHVPAYNGDAEVYLKD